MTWGDIDRSRLAFQKVRDEAWAALRSAESTDDARQEVLNRVDREERAWLKVRPHARKTVRDRVRRARAALDDADRRATDRPGNAKSREALEKARAEFDAARRVFAILCEKYLDQASIDFGRNRRVGPATGFGPRRSRVLDARPRPRPRAHYAGKCDE